MEAESKILTRAIEGIDATPTQRERLGDLVANADVPAWFETVDESPYALIDWLQALRAFEKWMEEKEIVERPVDSMIGYLECCTLSMAETLSPPDFSELVRDSLDQYGFDAAQPASAEPENENA